MSVSFDKKLAELDAYLQMLIAENESLDKKLTLLSAPRSSSSLQNLTSIDGEREGISEIKNNLDKLISSIKHAIVLLQIAKVSSKATGGSSSDLFTTPATPPLPPTPPTRPIRSARLAHQQSGSFTSSRDNSLGSSVEYSANSGDKCNNNSSSNNNNNSSKKETSSQSGIITCGGGGRGGGGNSSSSGTSGFSSGLPQPQQLEVSVAASATAAAAAAAVVAAVVGDVDEEDDEDPFFDAADDGDTTNTTTTTSTSIVGTTVTKIATKMPQTNSISNNNNNNNNLTNDNQQADGGGDDDDGGSIDWDALYEDEDEDELGSLENHGSVIKHLLSQIRIGMDLTKVVLPTFILERRSLLEMYADFFAHPDLFSAIPDAETPEERMVQLVRWYLSAFHAGRKSSVAKKPYNPILGEIFKCNWSLTTEKRNNNSISSNNNDNDNSTNSSKQEELTFVAEQVSHHPPVSAFYAENKEKDISCCAHIYTKSKYLGLSVGVHNLGQGVINVLKHKETYVCTFPSAYGRSILTVPWVELGGSVNITCEQTGFRANLEFVTKPFYGGKKHRVMGEILRPNNEPFLTIDGEWNGIMYSKSPPNSTDKQVFVDTTNLPVIRKQVKPVSGQETFESRNVWKEVTRALKLKDVTSATAAKSYIEQRQRDLLKDRLEKGMKWKTRFFEAADEGWRYSNELLDKSSTSTTG